MAKKIPNFALNMLEFLQNFRPQYALLCKNLLNQGRNMLLSSLKFIEIKGEIYIMKAALKIALVNA